MLPSDSPIHQHITLLRRKPRFLRLWMNVERVPFEALKERSRVCFGGFHPSKACGEATGFSPWGFTSQDPEGLS